MNMMRRNMWIFFSIPIMIHLIFLPLLFFESSGEISLAEIFTETIIIPIYLIIVSYKLLEHFSVSKFFAMLLLILVVTIFGIVISYFNWGITTGNLLNPDNETIYIIHWQMIIASVIVIVGWTVAYMIKHRTL